MQIRAFIFEDNIDLRDFLRQVLERRGYEVFTFSHPTICKECPCLPNQVCADIVLSDVNFMEQQHQQGCKIPNFALMSSDWFTGDMQQAQALGYHVFSKPFGIAEMEQWLDECETRINPTRQLVSFYQDEWHRH